MKDTLLKFPCEFVIKAFGYNNTAFEFGVLSIIKKYYPKFSEKSIRFKLSKEKKYVSMSVTILAESKKQLDAIYTELNSSKDVIMTL